MDIFLLALAFFTWVLMVDFAASRKAYYWASISALLMFFTSAQLLKDGTLSYGATTFSIGAVGVLIGILLVFYSITLAINLHHEVNPR